MKRVAKEATIENVLESIKENNYNRNQDMEPCFTSPNGSGGLLGSMELKNTYLPIYYDAWLYDHHDDPLMSLILVIVKEYGKLCDLKLNEDGFGD
ncbi:MAG: hypothetical protein HFH23_14550 [Ruminococcus sp.]|nr:hypothetical protein [Ruminococcus sp.]